MAAAPREPAERQRAPDRPDVLLVRRILGPAERSAFHRPTSRHWELIYTLTGRQRVRLHGFEFVMDPHSLVLFRNVPGAQHARRRDWKALHACFDPGPDWSPSGSLDRIGEDVYRSRVTRATVQQRIRDAFGRLLADARERVAASAVRSLATHATNGEGAEDDVQRELMLLTLREILLLASRGGDRGSPLDARVSDALEAMATDLRAAHTLRSLGRSSHLSPSRFGHLFRAELGVSPVRALRLMRLRHAKLQLLYTEDTVERIAESTGFTSSSHLGREFRREFGLSPRTYRAQTGLVGGFHRDG